MISFKRINYLFNVLLFLALIFSVLGGCGKSAKNASIVLNGTVSLTSKDIDPSRPVFLAIAKSDDFESILADPTRSLVTIISLDKTTGKYSINVSDKGLKAGDVVSVFAFVDNNYTGNIPNPDKGDVVGFYVNKETFSTSVTLKEGTNDFIDFPINRRVYDFDTSISGTITGDYTGQVILVAYTGEIKGLETSMIDFDQIIGFKSILKSTPSQSYTLPIFPYGYNVPIENVVVFAIFDSNGNGYPDKDDLLGYNTTSIDLPPTELTVTADPLTDITIMPVITVPGTSEVKISVSGTLTLPADYDPEVGALYVIVAKTDNPNEIMTLPATAIRYFEKLSPGATSYEADLSEAGVAVGDDVMVIALWDKDHIAGFPEPTSGDILGMYLPAGASSPTCHLAAGLNENVNIVIDQTMYNYEKTISGRIISPYTGNVVIIAYKGELNSMDMSSMNYNNIVGYQSLTKTQSIQSWTMPIYPVGNTLPIENVWLLALLDKNGNELPDPGEAFGFYSASSDQMPTQITLDSSVQNTLDIGSFMTIPVPSGHLMSIAGHVDIETGPGYTQGSKPLFVIVASASDADALFSNPLNAVKAFQKLSPGVSDFSIDLSETDLKPGDSVMVLALWDMDYTSGFPNPTAGDYVGYYQDKVLMKTTYTLKDGKNVISVDHSSGTYFSVNKKMFDHTASIKFKLANGGKVTLKKGDTVCIMAFQKTGVDSSYNVTDQDYVVAQGTITATGNTDDYYTVPVLPAQMESIVNSPFGIDNVYIYAVLDQNGNGEPDSGEPVGFYWNMLLYIYYPKLATISNTVNVLDKTVRFTNNTL